MQSSFEDQFSISIVDLGNAQGPGVRIPLKTEWVRIRGAVTLDVTLARASIEEVFDKLEPFIELEHLVQCKAGEAMADLDKFRPDNEH